MFRRTLLAFLAISVTSLIMTSPVEAGSGGGGAKGKNGTLRVLGAQNNLIFTLGSLKLPEATIGVGVIALPSTAAKVATYPSIAALQAAGGVIVNPGQVVQFKVGGPGRAIAYRVNEDSTLSDSSEAGYSGAQNQTGYLKITGPSYNPSINGTGEKF